LCSAGSLYILDRGNSKIRLLSLYNGTVSTFYNLPKDVKFESLDCVGHKIYLSGNDPLSSYVYKVSSM